jgi:hypothetical protein
MPTLSSLILFKKLMFCCVEKNLPLLSYPKMKGNEFPFKNVKKKYEPKPKLSIHDGGGLHQSQ